MLNTIQNCCLFSSPPHLREQNIEKCPRHSCSYTMCCHLCLQSNVHYVLCQQYCSLCCINCVRIGLTLSLFKTATIYVLTATHFVSFSLVGSRRLLPFRTNTDVVWALQQCTMIAFLQCWKESKSKKRNKNTTK